MEKFHKIIKIYIKTCFFYVTILTLQIKQSKGECIGMCIPYMYIFVNYMCNAYNRQISLCVWLVLGSALPC